MDKPTLGIIGPTAAGKTERALELAHHENVEIISVDSRQVYRHLAIGTAKPIGTWKDDRYLVGTIPYHLVDILDPNECFSAAQFVQAAEAKIAEIRARGKSILLVGGTGLYFKALIEGLAPMPPADAKIRDQLHQEAKRSGRAALHERLKKIDPAAAEKIPANNIARVVRALEVYLLTGKPISEWHKEHQRRSHLDVRFLYLDPGKEELKRRIEARCRRMVEQGMIEETRALLDKGYAADCPALTGLGYPRVIAYLNGEIDREELLRALIQDTLQYIKRQRTWFRNQIPSAEKL